MNIDIKNAREFIQQADAILITAGAGIGVDSGLPDFRGDEGFWKAYPPIEKLGLNFSEMANQKLFIDNPKLVWAFYGHRLDLYRKTIPHDGFRMLLDLTKKKNDNYFIFTSNVDGQFQKAGFSEDKICEIHGSIHHFQCTKYISHGIWNAEYENITVDMDNFQALNLPICKICGELARPNILMFSDFGWKASRMLNQKEKFNRWIKQNRLKKMVIIEIGAGTAIPTVQVYGDQLAKKLLGAKLIRINPCDYHTEKKLGIGLHMGALDGIKALLE